MTLRERRRALMGAQKRSVPDTSVEIMQTGVYWDSTSSNKGKKTSDANYSITKKYDIPPNTPVSTADNQVIGDVGTPSKKYVLYKNGSDTPFDYWVWSQARLTEGAQQISFSVRNDAIDSAYAYIRATGHLFFAGPNSPYYGKTNIND